MSAREKLYQRFEVLETGLREALIPALRQTAAGRNDLRPQGGIYPAWGVNPRWGRPPYFRSPAGPTAQPELDLERSAGLGLGIFRVSFRLGLTPQAE